MQFRSLVSRVATKFAALFRRRAINQRVDEELQFHLHMQVKENIGRGIDPQDARRKLGNLTQVSEEVYGMNTISFLEETLRNVRFSLRTVRKNPGFAAAAILTLAIGIGANTAVFSVVDGVLLKPLAYPEPERLVSISHFAPGFGGIIDQTGMRLSTGMYFTYLHENRSFENMGVWNSSMVSVSGASDPEQVLAIGVSTGTLEALAIQPLLGHLFSDEDQKPGAAQTILLTHGYWQQRFGGDVVLPFVRDHGVDVVQDAGAGSGRPHPAGEDAREVAHVRLAVGRHRLAGTVHLLRAIGIQLYGAD